MCNTRIFENLCNIERQEVEETMKFIIKTFWAYTLRVLKTGKLVNLLRIMELFRDSGSGKNVHNLL